ncbi:MAG: 23S rRNA (uracil(1939)-C(5))-methyltransferase RlmD [bacterium]
MNIKKGSELNLDIETLAFGGRGVAKVDSLVVFVDGALPGQQVIAKIIRKRKDYAEARALGVVKESLEAVEPRCPYFGECGGCLLQNLEYMAQLKYKRQQIGESLQHLGGFKSPPVLDTLPSPEQYYYRNKMEYSFGPQRWLSAYEIEHNEILKPKNFALGLHVRGRFNKILDIDACYLQSPRSVEILNFVRQFALDCEIPPYSTQDHSGFWRHLVVREGKNTGQTMVNIVTADAPEFFNVVEQLAVRLTEKFPDLTTIVHSINRKKAQIAIGDEVRVLFGSGSIKERIGSRMFQISANSFFQTNTNGAELLYEKIVEFAEFKVDEIVYDLYSGAGTISLYIANHVQQVVGFELVENAVRDSEINCQLNGTKNCVFVQGDLKDALAMKAELFEKWGKPDTIIIDPPRAGMHVKVLTQVLKIRPNKIVYVSCNPATFARDAKELCQSQYELKNVQPVDMFPMTPHIELVSLLKRIGA